MGSEWVLNNEAKIYTLVKAKSYPELVKLFPKIYFTTSDETNDNAVFPTVYIHELPGIEQGIDFERDIINSVLSTFEVKVTVNTKKSDVTKIMAIILSAFKELRFEVVFLPTEILANDNLYYATGRFRRLISTDDHISI